MAELLPTALLALFYIITLVFVVYSVSVAYHWFVYGESKKVSTTALAIYLIGSTPLFLIMSLSLSLL